MKGVIAWFAANSVAANLLMLALMVSGLVTFSKIEQKSFPDIDVNVIQISIPYLGAAPEEVESGVCIRVEEAIQGINGIEFINSLAVEGACIVSAELLTGYPEDRAQSEIKNAIDAVTTFPRETETPIIAHFVMRSRVIKIALSGNADERTLKIYGQRIRDEIASIPGITQVEMSGARDYEISIELSEESLRRHQIGFDDIVEAVRKSSLDMPGGSIKTDGGDILLRSKGQAYSGREFEELVILTRRDGTRLLLGDIATVVDGFAEELSYSRFDGEPAVMIQVFRIGDQKILDLVAKVRDYVDSTQAWLPAGLKLTVWSDSSSSLRDRLDILLRNGRNGFVLVFVLLAFFLRLRLAFWVSIGVPLSILGALALFPYTGVSINVISLFAFILVLGLLVDDAIVVAESVHSHQERAENPLQSAISGTQEVSIPVIFGVLTTIAAFLPLVLADGMMGQIFAQIGIVVILCLIFSVVESQLVLPAHLAHSRRPESESARGPIQRRWKKVQSFMSGSLTQLAENGYRPILVHALEWRYLTIALGVMCLLFTMAPMASGRLKFAFFPEVEADYVTASLEMPLGSPVAVTAQAIAQIEAAAIELRNSLRIEFPETEDSVIVHLLSSVGSRPSGESRHGGGRRGGPSNSSHIGEVTIELMGADLRPLEAAEIERRWRELTPTIPDAVELRFSSAMFSAGDALGIRLLAPDVEDLRLAAGELRRRLSEYPGVMEIRDSFRDGKDEVKLSILPAAQSLGLSLQDLARQVRQAFYGVEAQRIQRGRDEVRVMVRYPAAERHSLGDLEAMRIRTPDGAEVAFGEVARALKGRGYASISRTNRMREIRVNAAVDSERANSSEIMADLQANFMPELLANHPGLSYRLHGEQREQSKVLMGMFRDFGLALVLIYALLAIPLRSYSQPLIIMAVIPFGLVGAVLGHLLMGMESFSMMSLFGVVALAGVVVNASLVMVHYVNNRRAQGLSLRDAVGEAGVARFRPIVLTSLTTFVGLTPLLMEKGVSAQFLIPMAISLAFGVAFATVVTLFLVPCAYVILEDLRGIGGGFWRSLLSFFGTGSEPDRAGVAQRSAADPTSLLEDAGRG